MARIAVAATAPFGADVLGRLAGRHEIVSLLTRPDAPSGRGRRLAPPPAKVAAERLGVAVLQPEALEPDLDLDAAIVVICAYGVIVPESLLAERLWLNVHPSLLPRWRGAAPVERAILAGDAVTGVTIHQTVKELDAGPIAAQSRFPVGEQDAGEIFARSAELAVELLDEVLSHADVGDLRSLTASFVPQAHDEATYAEKIGPEDRLLDLNLPAGQLVRRVRALAPHIGARAVLDDRPVTVWAARIGEDGGFEPLEVQPEGGRRMPVADWRRGLRA